jgi:hypothetical protein
LEPRALVLKNSLDIAHMVFNAVTGDLTDESSSFEVPGGMLPRASAIMAHAIWGEDMVVSAVLEQPTVFASAGMATRSGFEPSNSLSPEFVAQQFDLASLRDYASEVFGRTASGLETVTSAQLDRRVQTPMGSEMDAASFLGAFGIVHLAQHTGDISALKGVQGMKGLPF